MNATRWNRREVLGGVLAAGALSGAPFRPSLGQQPAGGMTERSELLIRNGYVLTMDAQLGDIAGGDVHLRGGAIAAVGRGLNAPGAQIIEGAGMLVLPGFVETHWHIWTALLRSLAGDRQEHGYFPTSRTIGTFYSAEDMYAAGRLAAAEAIHSGITFVHDWCHNVRGPDYAEAALRALEETGIRARFSYGSPTAASNDASIDLRDLARLAERWDEHANGGLLTLGLAWRGAASVATLRDYEVAKELGLPISVHANNSGGGVIQQLADRGLLVPSMQIIHAVWCTPEEIRAMVANRVTVSVSPYSELRIGFGFPITADLIEAGVTVGLSVDTTTLSGNADMFAIMKAIQNIENGRARNEFKMTARRVLELATIDGARSMGIGDRVGSLTPGKRADVIMVDTRAVNLGVLTEPAHLLVEAAQPANVDTVIVDGRVLKRGGRLTSVDVAEVVDAAARASAGVRRRSGWSWPSQP
ncbi:MAG TPA: amidohydrolase family protein [Gammaproteobacteria bacterium]|nr:amidohydrolase family protein [Gammaproteobacteria bacterium]